MDILVIGTGMYVSGRGTEGFGTIMPSIIEWKRNGGDLNSIYMVGTNRKRSLEAFYKAEMLQKLTGVTVDLEVYPKIEDQNLLAYRKVLNSINKPACAIVAVPDHLHFEITKDCLNAGLHTLVVKPLTALISEAKSLIELAKKHNLYGTVEFHKRWDRQNRILRDEYQNGKLGKPLYTWAEYSQRKSIPSRIFLPWVEKTNIFQYLGVHYIDIIRFVTGAIPVRVMATGQKSWLKEQGLDVYDSIQGMVVWETLEGHRFNQTLLVNWIDPENSSSMSDQRLKFVGTTGRFEGDQKERGVRLLYDDKALDEPNPDFCTPYQTTDGFLAWEGYGIESTVNFLKDVENITAAKFKPQDLEGNRPTFTESVFSTSVIEAAEVSLKNNSDWVVI